MRKRPYAMPLLGALLLMGCKASYRPVETREERVSVEQERTKTVEYRDTTIYVSVPTESYREYSKDTSTLKTRYAISRAWIENCGVVHTLASIPQVEGITLSKAVKQEVEQVRRDSIVYRESRVPYPVPKALSWWDRFRLNMANTMMVLLPLMLVLNNYFGGIIRKILSKFKR